MNIVSEKELYEEAKKRMKEIVKGMNGLSEEGFTNKYNNDPFFRKGFDVLVQLFMKAKFDA